MEGYLQMKIHLRRKRYCVLEGRTMRIFQTPQDVAAGNPPRRQYGVVAVKDVAQLDKTTLDLVLGTSSYRHAFVITAEKSKVYVAEAANDEDKQKWIQAIDALNLPAKDNTFLSDMLKSSMFDAHTAVAYVVFIQFQVSKLTTPIIS